MAKYLSTLPNVGAGVGHQFAEWNCGFLLAKRYGLTFVHRRFAIWEDFLRFGEGEVGYTDIFPLPPGKRVVHLPMLDLQSEQGISQLEKSVETTNDGDLLHLAYGQNMFDQTATAGMVSRKYWLTHTPSTIYKTGSMKVGVHIRRGDILRLPPDECASRILPNSYYVAQIESLKSIYPSLDIHIFSEGDPSQFSELGHYALHLNENHFESFNNLASADILILSRSGFSYLAGLVSSGLKITPYPWWHKFPDEWIKI